MSKTDGPKGLKREIEHLQKERKTIEKEFKEYKVHTPKMLEMGLVNLKELQNH